MNFNKILKTIVILCVSISTVIAIARFCHRETQGFKLTKIQGNLCQDSFFIPQTQEDKKLLTTLFHQTFTFLGRGLQSFVFVSEDGEYVLKIFNNRYQQKIFLFSLLEHVPWIGPWAKERQNYFRTKLAKTWESYQLAFTEMKNQTGLIYVHLSETSHLPSQIQLVDKLNIVHCLNPNHLGFLIQKKAKLVFPALKEYVNQSDLDSAKQALSSLIDLFLWKWRHAILDNDPLIRTNYGFIGTQAIQIDVGPLSKASSPLEISQYREEIFRIMASLKCWLTENCPELTPFLDRELEQQLSFKG